VDLIDGCRLDFPSSKKPPPQSALHVGTITEIHDYLRFAVRALWAIRIVPITASASKRRAWRRWSIMCSHCPSIHGLMIVAPTGGGTQGRASRSVRRDCARPRIRTAAIDGKVYEIDNLPKLKKNFKHTVDVIVDRLKVREDAKQRLAQSFETALRHADGRALCG
jgi:excinuclease ABC subunit A